MLKEDDVLLIRSDDNWLSRIRDDVHKLIATGTVFGQELVHRSLL